MSVFADPAAQLAAHKRQARGTRYGGWPREPKPAPNPIPLRQRILAALLSAPPGEEMHRDEVVARADSERSAVDDLLRTLIAEGLAERVRRGYYRSMAQQSPPQAPRSDF